LKHKNVTCTNWDLPFAEPLAKEYIAKFGLSERIKTQSGDFFKDTFPSSDVIVIGNVMPGWGIECKRMLFKKAYDALTPNGVLIVAENIIDADRRTHL